MQTIIDKNFDRERALYGSDGPADGESAWKKSRNVEKNSLSGRFHVPCVGEIIRDDEKSKGKVILPEQCCCA